MNGPIHEVYHSARQAASTLGGTLTTGDARLDEMLGGGIRPGVITELVGESASGKTQLALQISLLVQHPPVKGGLSGSSCYLTTNGVLPTSRLVEIAQQHLLITQEAYNLANIHTRPTSSVSELRHILSQGIPILIQRLAEDLSTRPLKLLVVDSMSTLLHSDTKTTSQTLFERSRELTDIALMFHHLASKHHLAILVINEVNSIFERVSSASGLPRDRELDRVFYSEQARWFSRGNSLPSEDFSEAGLGLVWANQVGLRIMMTRTGRRRHVLYSGSDTKRRYHSTVDRDIERGGEEATLIRRLSIIFSSFSPLDSIDFIILPSGVISVSDKLSLSAC